MSDPEHCTLCAGRLLEETAGMLSATFNELIPPEAQSHLFAAQRELLLAMVATLDHHARGRRGDAGEAGDGTAPSRRPSRVELD